MSCIPPPSPGQPVCLPYLDPSSTNPGQAAIPQQWQNPIGNAPGGCVPSPAGQCQGGDAGSLPMPGPNTQYFASGYAIACGCLIASVEATLWAGGSVEVSALGLGTVLLGVDANWSSSAETVTGVQTVTSPTIIVTFQGGSIQCSPTHPFYAGQDTVITAAELEVGMTVLDSSGNPQAVTAIQGATTQKVYCISTAPDGNYVVKLSSDTPQRETSDAGGDVVSPPKIVQG